jgi:hypothetical protein
MIAGICFYIAMQSAPLLVGQTVESIAWNSDQHLEIVNGMAIVPAGAKVWDPCRCDVSPFFQVLQAWGEE